jgi:hypothetical protein
MFPAGGYRITFALLNAVELGAATSQIRDLSPGALMRLRHEISEQLGMLLHSGSAGLDDG